MTAWNGSPHTAGRWAYLNAPDGVGCLPELHRVHALDVRGARRLGQERDGVHGLDERRRRDVHVEHQPRLARPQRLLVAQPHLHTFTVGGRLPFTANKLDYLLNRSLCTHARPEHDPEQARDACEAHNVTSRARHLTEDEPASPQLMALTSGAAPRINVRRCCVTADPPQRRRRECGRCPG